MNRMALRAAALLIGVPLSAALLGLALPHTWALTGDCFGITIVERSLSAVAGLGLLIVGPGALLLAFGGTRLGWGGSYVTTWLIIGSASLAPLAVLAGCEAAIRYRYASVSTHLCHSTQWSSRFTEEAFVQVPMKSDPEAAIRLLGAPIRRFTDRGSDIWAYSDIGKYTSIKDKAFHQRWLVFQGGRLNHRLKRYLTTDQDPLR